MSEENAELVRKALTLWRDVDAQLADRQQLMSFFAPDAVWDVSTVGGWPGRSEFRGIDEFLEFRDSWYEAYEEWSYEAEKVLDAGGDLVVATFYQRARLRGSDSWVDLRYGIVYTVDGGIIQRSQAYASPGEALEAAGLSE